MHGLSWLALGLGLVVAAGCGESFTSGGNGGGDSSSSQGGASNSSSGQGGMATTGTASGGGGNSSGSTGGSGGGGGEACGAANLQETPLFYSTLNSLDAASNPIHGSGANLTYPMLPGFVPALSGNGAEFKNVGQLLNYALTVNGTPNLSLNRGTMDLCFRPYFNSMDNQNQVLLRAVAEGGSFLQIRKADVANNFRLQVTAQSTVNGTVLAETNFDPAEVMFTNNQFMRLMISWDFGVAPGERQVHVYRNGIEAQPVSNNNEMPGTGPMIMPSVNVPGNILVGGLQNNWVANGLFDEFVIYGEALEPPD